MAQPLFGVETEYALTVLDSRGTARDGNAVLGRFWQLAEAKLAHLPDGTSTGMFLPNGSRFYVDFGNHPEFTTPECADPWDVVRYIQAGERILAGLASDLAAQEPTSAEAVLLRCNVDYGGSESSWGCHESYLHRADPAIVPPQIIPHLVSRIVYTGAGGFDNHSCRGIEFTLSPRVCHITHVVSAESTRSRGIFHTKDESLSGSGYHRLHILCGESLCSETAAWLKIGATALVVAMIEAGLGPGNGVQLCSPLDAMRAFARDPTCRAAAKCDDGTARTAVAIQRHYLSHAEAHLQEPYMPPWAADVCRTWRAVLDRLEAAPGAVATTLDWAIKLALYKDRAGRQGIAWESLSHWNHVARTLGEALARAGRRERSLPTEVILGQESPVRAEVKLLTPFLHDRGLTWDDFRAFVLLRQELFEIDARIGQLGERGIFTTMDRAGVLAHRVPGVDRIEQAMESPPAVGRARLRGEYVRRLAGSGDRYWCHWDRVVDREEGREIDLTDPFLTTARWKAQPREPDDAGSVSVYRRLRERFAALRG